MPKTGGQERGAAPVQPAVLRLGRAGVRVADGGLHLLQLGLRLRTGEVPAGLAGPAPRAPGGRPGPQTSSSWASTSTRASWPRTSTGRWGRSSSPSLAWRCPSASRSSRCRPSPTWWTCTGARCARKRTRSTWACTSPCSRSWWPGPSCATPTSRQR